MVAPLGFLDAVQVLGERLVGLPRGAVDALQHRALLVAPPVRARDLRELERAERARRRHVRPATQVDEVDAVTIALDVAVERDAAVAARLPGVLRVGFAGADLRDDLALVR